MYKVKVKNKAATIDERKYPEKKIDVSTWAKHGFGHDKIHGDRALEREDNYANHKNHSRLAFLRTLVEHRKDLTITRPHVRDNKQGNEPADGRIESDKDGILFNSHIAPLECPMCEDIVQDTSKLLEHLLNHEEKSKPLYYAFGVISKEIDAVFRQAIEKQKDHSYIEKNIVNNDLVLKCPIGSPLGSFLTLRRLKVYLGVLPQSLKLSKNEIISQIIKIGGQDQNLFFDYADVEKHRNSVHEEQRRKKEDKNTKYLTDLIKWNDIEIMPKIPIQALERIRNKDQRAIQSMKLPHGSSQQEIIAEFEKNITFFHRKGRTAAFDSYEEGKEQERLDTLEQPVEAQRPSTSTRAPRGAGKVSNPGGKLNVTEQPNQSAETSKVSAQVNSFSGSSRAVDSRELLNSNDVPEVRQTKAEQAETGQESSNAIPSIDGESSSTPQSDIPSTSTVPSTRRMQATMAETLRSDVLENDAPTEGPSASARRATNMPLNSELRNLQIAMAQQATQPAGTRRALASTSDSDSQGTPSRPTSPRVSSELRNLQIAMTEQVTQPSRSRRAQAQTSDTTSQGTSSSSQHTSPRLSSESRNVQIAMTDQAIQPAETRQAPAPKPSRTRAHRRASCATNEARLLQTTMTGKSVQPIGARRARAQINYSESQEPSTSAAKPQKKRMSKENLRLQTSMTDKVLKPAGARRARAQVNYEE